MSRKNLFPNGEMSLGVNYWASSVYVNGKAVDFISYFQKSYSEMIFG